MFENRQQNAIGALDEQYGRLGLYTAQNILHNEQDAKECLNDAYLAVWDTIPPQHPEHLAAYLLKIVRNLSLKRFAFLHADKRSGVEVGYEELEACIPDIMWSEENLSEVINGFLASLPKAERILFVRRYWYGISVKGLAKVYRKKPNTIAVKLHRIREKMKEYLEREGVSL